MNYLIIIILQLSYSLQSFALGELDLRTQITCRQYQKNPNFLICDNDKIYKKKIFNIHAFNSSLFKAGPNIINREGKNYLEVEIPSTQVDGRTSSRRSAGVTNE